MPDAPPGAQAPREPHRGFGVGPVLWAALAALGLLTPLFVHHARTVRMDASVEVFFGADERSKESFDKLESMMTESVACMVLGRFDGIFSDEGADLVHRVGMALADLDGVPSVFSLTRARRPVRKPGFQLDVRKLIEFEPFLPRDGRSDAEWEEIRASVLDFPWARDLLVSSDGRWAMWVAEIERPLPDHAARVQLRSEVEQALAPFRGEMEALHFGGFPFIEAEVREDVERDVLRFLVALPVLLGLVLLFAFRSWTALFAVLAFEVMGIAFLPVLVNWNGTTLNLYTAILLPLIAGLQLTFLTHLFSGLRARLRLGQGFAQSLEGALRHVLRPAAVAALTTAVGLVSLVSCEVGLVRDFGLLGAQGVAVAFAVTFLPVQVASWWASRRARVAGPGAEPSSYAEPAWLERLQSGSLARPGWVLAAGLLVVFAAVPAARSLRTDLRAIEFLSPDSVSRTTMDRLDEEMGGMNLFELGVDTGATDGIQRPEVLQYLERIERYARDLEGVTNVYGYAQLYAVLNQIWHRDDPEERRVPTDPGSILAMGKVVHGEEFLFGDEIFGPERQRTTLFLRTRDMAASRYLALLEDFVGYAEREAPAGVLVDGKSGIHSVLESDRRIVRSQAKSLALCALVVFVTLALLLRSLRTAAIALAVNAPPLAAILALHGYAGIPLNSVTVMVGAVVLGIAVDNCIHVLAFWNEEVRAGAAPGPAARAVVAQKLSAMTCTAAVLVGGLGLFLFSSFPPVADFGVLAVVGLGLALVSTVVLLPPAVGLGQARSARETSPTPEAVGPAVS